MQVQQPTPVSRGAAGFRLLDNLKATLPDTTLRGLAFEILGAERVSSRCLEALRVVLGNQAHAERNRYTLEMNIRTSFATERVMRTIIDQMKVAGISTGKRVSLGSGRTQVVQVFQPQKTGHLEPDPVVVASEPATKLAYPAFDSILEAEVPF